MPCVGASWPYGSWDSVERWRWATCSSVRWCRPSVSLTSCSSAPSWPWAWPGTPMSECPAKIREFSRRYRRRSHVGRHLRCGARPEAAELGAQSLGAFGGEEKLCPLELDAADRAGNGVGQPPGPGGIEKVISSTPHDQRGSLEPGQVVAYDHRHAVVHPSDIALDGPGSARRRRDGG